jgi:hypothetical protein
MYNDHPLASASSSMLYVSEMVYFSLENPLSARIVIYVARVRQLMLGFDSQIMMELVYRIFSDHILIDLCGLYKYFYRVTPLKLNCSKHSYDIFYGMLDYDNKAAKGSFG